jgi:hypothetical protein
MINWPSRLKVCFLVKFVVMLKHFSGLKSPSVLLRLCMPHHSYHLSSNQRCTSISRLDPLMDKPICNHNIIKHVPHTMVPSLCLRFSFLLLKLNDDYIYVSTCKTILLPIIETFSQKRHVDKGIENNVGQHLSVGVTVRALYSSPCPTKRAEATILRTYLKIYTYRHTWRESGG